MTSHLSRAAIADAATGPRSTVAVAGLIEAGDPGLPHSLPGRSARTGASIGALGELVADKLPQTLSRLSPASLAGPLAMASAAGAVIARSARHAWVPAALVAGAAAVASAKVGHDSRAAEDALALGLGAARA